MNLHREEPLAGGNTGVSVIRVGDTVRRPARPWSSSVDALLLHLESIGFEGAPRALGYDDLGRQVLSYIPGDASPDPGDLGVSDIESVGRLIREFHDAASTFIPPRRLGLERCHHAGCPGSHLPSRPGSVEPRQGSRPVCLHRPGSRLWDLAYAAHGFAPLSPRYRRKWPETANRLRVLANGYGLDGKGRAALAEMLAPRINSMYQLLARGSETGAELWRMLWSQGHGEAWLDDYEFAEERLEHWRDALS